MGPTPLRLRQSNGSLNRFAWAGYGAFVLAALYGLVSLYWAVGGSYGLGTLGGSIEGLAMSHTAGAAAVISVVITLKFAGALLALTLVGLWGRRFPPRPVLLTSYLVSGLLVLYGLTNVVGETLVELGIVRPATPVDWRALRWHLGLWDMWFLVWGILLGVTTWGFQHSALMVRSLLEDGCGG